MGSQGIEAPRTFILSLGNRPHANLNGGSLVRNTKHLYFQGINIEDIFTSLLLMRQDGSMIQRHLELQCSFYWPCNRRVLLLRHGHTTSPHFHYGKRYVSALKKRQCTPSHTLNTRPRRTRTHRHIVMRTRTCARASSRDFARMP